MSVPQALYSSMRFVFLYADYYEFRKGWVYPKATTPYCLIRYITEGNAIFEINNSVVTVHAGEVIYIPEGSLLTCYSEDELFSFYSIRFLNSIRLANHDVLRDFFSLPLVSPAVPDCIYHYFQNLYMSAFSHRIDKIFRIRGYLELIIAELVHLANPLDADGTNFSDSRDALSLSNLMEREYVSKQRSKEVINDPRIQIAVNYIIANPTFQFNEKYLCKLACLSQSSLRRLFKQQTGKSPREFAKELKMIAAARQLLTTDLPIATVSTELGFEDPNYFSRAFKKTFGVSPQKYRLRSHTVGNEQMMGGIALEREGQLKKSEDDR